MYQKLKTYIDQLHINDIPEERRAVLFPLIKYISDCKSVGKPAVLNFICTHNSRRSHLAQVWAQTMADYYNITKVHCYSGGTEATAMFPKISEVLRDTGFGITALSFETNPVYAVKTSLNSVPIIGFSKTYDHPFNPKDNFAAVMTCDSADKNCPYIPGALRISVTYKDPKASDGTPQQNNIYLARSKQIASEMKYVFSNIVN